MLLFMCRIIGLLMTISFFIRCHLTHYKPTLIIMIIFLGTACCTAENHLELESQICGVMENDF